MRIAQIVCSLEPGGAERLAADLSIALAQRGHEVDVLAIDRFTAKEYEKDLASRLERAGVRLHSFGRRLGSRSQALASSFRLWAANWRRRYDVFHSHLPMPDAIACLARLCTPWAVRHVVTVHSTRQRWDAVTTRLVRGCRIVCCSQPVAASLEPLLRTGRVIPNGVDLARFGYDSGDRSTLLRSPSCGPGQRLIVSVSSLSERKNLAGALRAVKALRERRPDLDVRYVICGDGAERENLENLTRDPSLSGRVSLLGVRTDVADLLQTAHAFLSASSYEGMPISVLEALASGLPCVLSPIPEHETLASRMAGCFVASDRTPETLAQAIGDALDFAPSREGLFNLRREALEEFSIHRAAEAYERVYTET